MAISQAPDFWRPLTLALVSRGPDPSSDDARWVAWCDASIDQSLAALIWHHFHHVEAVKQHEALSQEARRVLVMQTLFMRERDRIDALFTSQDIHPIWLKGAVLGALYPDTSCRPMVDLDFWIEPSQRTKVAAILADCGYQPISYPAAYSEVAIKLAKQTTHHDIYEGGPAKQVTLEAHFALFEKALLHTTDYAEMRRFVDSNATPQQLNSAAHLAYLAAHAFLSHGEAELTILRLLDIHLVLEKQRPKWSDVQEVAELMGWQAAVSRALELCQVYFDADITGWQSDSVEDATVAGLSSKGSRVFRVARRLKQLNARDRVAYVFGLAFPTPAYMRRRYGSDGNLIGLYIWRFFDICKAVWAWAFRKGE